MGTKYQYFEIWIPNLLIVLYWVNCWIVFASSFWYIADKFLSLQQLAPDMGMTPLDEPSQIKTSCDEEAAEIVNRISVRDRNRD